MTERADHPAGGGPAAPVQGRTTVNATALFAEAAGKSGLLWIDVPGDRAWPAWHAWADDTVFIACRMTVGYGYEVWRMDSEFADGKKIIEGLSGCCGQMDVQANDEGVFVAENSRKRVRRFDADGQSVCDWGKASESVHGFGSCCTEISTGS